MASPIASSGRLITSVSPWFTHMKTSTRRSLGAVLLGLSVVCPFMLVLSGVGTQMESHSETNDVTAVTSTAVIVEVPPWLSVGSLCVAGAGLLLLFWPNRDQTSA